MPKKAVIQPSVEVTSRQLFNELSEIKDRVGALENVAGIANEEILYKYFKEILTNDQKKKIVEFCKEPKTRAEIISALKFNSAQALHHHLKPLREDGVIHEMFDGEVSRFGWSLLFKRLSERKKKALFAQ